MRLAITFPSADAYDAGWRAHPAFAEAWNDDIEAYVLHDLTGKPGAFKYLVSVQALETDSDDMLSDMVNRNAINLVQTPIHLLRALRGRLNRSYGCGEFHLFVVGGNDDREHRRHQRVPSIRDASPCYRDAGHVSKN